MSNDGNVTIDREPCFEARNFLESDFPEIFLAGLGCILLNIIFFLSWVREIIKVGCVSRLVYHLKEHARFIIFNLVMNHFARTQTRTCSK